MAAKRKRMLVLRDYLDAHLRTHGCADCGETDVDVLEFDHVGAKTDNIAVLWRRGRGLKELKRELACCEVVCVNCHRRRTAARGAWWRLDIDRPPGNPRPRQERNVTWVYRQLSASACVDCGESDIVVLEFDHVAGSKRDSVLNLAWAEYSLDTLRREVALCEVRCCNCHRRKTLERRVWASD